MFGKKLKQEHGTKMKTPLQTLELNKTHCIVEDLS